MSADRLPEKWSEAMERGSLGDGFAGAEGEAGRFP
jgi:hypothetical protein